MGDEATELERCFGRFTAARAALEQATAHRKEVFTQHSPAWYAAVEAESECFNRTYEAHQGLKALLTASAEEAAPGPTGARWSLRMPESGGMAAAPA